MKIKIMSKINNYFSKKGCKFNKKKNNKIQFQKKQMSFVSNAQFITSKA